MIYVYDGTWDGLMCLIHRTAVDARAPEAILRTGAAASGLPFDAVRVESVPAVAEATASVLKGKVSAPLLSEVGLALLSENNGVEFAAWHCLEAVWRLGRRAESDLASPFRSAVRRAALQTEREYNRYLGLVRFQDTGGVFYASIEPGCDVAVLLGAHFKDRLPGQVWVLHDLRRGRAAVCDGKNWAVTDLRLADLPPLTEAEARYQGLWRRFFQSAATRERLSAKRQSGHMPKKYWKHLIEIPQETASPGE